ncbi:Uncharacterised protein [Mycobacteroides abscessus subsp. abscessus]|nr:Uncharacterised protein [Mycobacteroides abscessus subsp. abscessus]SIN51971.1 Uncharacterised protein [Mycobacteroides abscessus subsp. abscessus]SKU24634.1 Uncharacterised protein [Mycobacteroides abscessus subsp. abscessus]SKV06198.1 Uncharacterised protein [Mycobacteroides abscessus subsp. abscessus]
MLHVGGIGSQLPNQRVVVGVRLVIQWLLSLQHDHRHAVGIRLSEHLAHPLHRPKGRRRLRNQRHRAFPTDLLQRRNSERDDGYHAQPAEDDRYGEPSNQPGQQRRPATHPVDTHPVVIR